MIFGVWKNLENFGIVDSLIVALIAIIIVFAVLAIIIFISWAVQKGVDKVDGATHILPKEENKILDEDPDAVAAALAAVIDFHKETGKDAEIVSIKKVED